jgi:hypothetical protein
MKRAVVLVTAAAALAAPASALGAPRLAVALPSGPVPARPSPAGATTPAQLPLNYASDRKALTAYATYLTTLMDGASTGDANDTAFIAQVSGQCKSALSPLTQPNEQVNTAVQHTLTVLGQEMGDDLAIGFDQAAAPAFAKFSATLARLHWTRLTGWSYAVKHYISAETALLALSVSQLCVNASTAELRPSIVPDATRTFTKAYSDASKLADAGLTNLTKLMQAYEIPSEKALVTRISNLAGELASQTKADLLANGTSLTTVLESS